MGCNRDDILWVKSTSFFLKCILDCNLQFAACIVMLLCSACEKPLRFCRFQANLSFADEQFIHVSIS